MTISKRERIFVLAGVIIVLLLSAKLFVAPFFKKVEFVEESLEGKAALLLRYRTAADEMELIGSRRAALSEEVEAMEDRLFNAATASLASAEMQSMLEKMVKRRKAKIKSVRTIKAEDMAPYTKIGVEITFYSDVKSLLDLLYDMEGNSKGLSIAQLRVHYQDGPDQQRLRTTLRVESGSKNGDR